MFRREVATARNLSCRALDEEEDIGEGQHHSKSLIHVGLSCPLKGVLRFKWSEMFTVGLLVGCCWRTPLAV